MGNAEAIMATTVFRRHSFAFKATKTINAADPVTKDIGARLYFDRITPGNRITLANVEIVPLSAAGASMRTELFANASVNPAYFRLPRRLEQPRHLRALRHIPGGHGDRVAVARGATLIGDRLYGGYGTARYRRRRHHRRAGSVPRNGEGRRDQRTRLRDQPVTRASGQYSYTRSRVATILARCEAPNTIASIFG